MKYEVQILEKKGTMAKPLFEKMAKNGDVNPIKITEILNSVVRITGYAVCQITTDDKEFTMNYFDTEEFGAISSGSEIFLNSVKDYFGEVDKVRISEVKTKKGKTYKATPILNNEQKEENKEQETSDDLPF